MNKYLLTCFGVFYLCSSQGQINTTFSFGSLGVENATTSIFTGPLVMEGQTQCLTLQNGVNLILNNNANGIFKLGCKINGVKENLKFTLFPNPSNDYFITKTDHGYLLDSKIDLSIQDIRGTVVFDEEVNPSQLKQGYRINTARFANGLYLIKVITSKETHTYKLIKTGN